jgi:7-cyano-7-deazaguanine synthase
MNRRALVLFSGGQDSATCLAWALDRYDYVETIGFDYGQRHKIELLCRNQVIDSIRRCFPVWGARLGEDHVLDLGLLGRISDTALTDHRAIEMQRSGLPNTFVPGRNLLFFILSAAIAYRREIDILVGGMCETDFSGYPDCRDNTLKALQVAMSLGLDSRLIIEAPLMWLSKAETWALAESLGEKRLVDLIRHETHTCYLGNRETSHDWGVGCGECPACELRSRGYREYQRIGQS